jgi:hypothetical protein
MDPPKESLEFNQAAAPRPNIDSIIPRPALSKLVCSPSQELSSQDDKEWEESRQLFIASI